MMIKGLAVMMSSGAGCGLLPVVASTGGADWDKLAAGRSPVAVVESPSCGEVGRESSGVVGVCAMRVIAVAPYNLSAAQSSASTSIKARSPRKKPGSTENSSILLGSWGSPRF